MTNTEEATIGRKDSDLFTNARTLAKSLSGDGMRLKLWRAPDGGWFFQWLHQDTGMLFEAGHTSAATKEVALVMALESAPTLI